nr:hypothetical protein [Klebsiella pneumoniae]
KSVPAATAGSGKSGGLVVDYRHQLAGLSDEEIAHTEHRSGYAASQFQQRLLGAAKAAAWWLITGINWLA